MYLLQILVNWKSLKKIIEEAKEKKNGIYIFNRNQSEAVVMSVNDYEKMIQKIDSLQEKLLDYQVNKLAAHRINEKQKGYSEEEVFGSDGLNDISVSDDDGWE